MADGAGPSTATPPNTASPTTEPSGGLRGLLSRLTSPRRVVLQDVLENGHGPAAGLSDAERTMLERIVSFDKKRVDDVAIPRADIVGIAVDASLSDVLNTFSEANHSRLPVYRGDLDDPIGMVHIKDIVGIIADPEQSNKSVDDRTFLERINRKIIYVPPSMPVTELLLRMQASRVHMALVIDEYGGTDGLVTIEDLIELIVGDIRDEHDDAEDFSIGQRAEGKWEADARVPLEDFAEATGTDIRLSDHEADTVGGLVLSLSGRVPLRGEVIDHPSGHEIDVIDANPRTVRRVLVRLGASPSITVDGHGPDVDVT